MNYKYIGTAVIGLAVGAIGGWFLAKHKYQAKDICEEEEVEEVEYEEPEEDDGIVVTTEIPNYDIREAARNKPSLAEMIKDLQEEIEDEPDEEPKVVEHNAFDDAAKIKNPDAIDIPYLINAKEFNSLNNYNKLTFTKFADSIYTDEYGDEIDDAELYLSGKIMDYIEGSEKTEFYVRNDARSIDIEIVTEDRNFYNDSEDE